jgi:pimeloyl-ACP methyl ester carboxylesterase
MPRSQPPPRFKRPLVLLALLAPTLGALLGPTLGAQVGPARLDAVDHQVRLARIARSGDLGLPPLPPVTAESPLNTIVFADRMPVTPDTSAYGGVPDPVLQDGFIPKGEGGTGTDKGEIFQFMLPWDYDPNGPPIPLLIAYHGFGSSAQSPAAKTTLDEEANLRGWAYLAPTGIDDQLFGAPVSQQNTEAALDWMLAQYNLDPDRLYMVGFSMGAGISANFAARRRDPDGNMIAALGLVSAVSDWTMTYFVGTTATKDLLKNSYNFGAHPNQVPFLYQQASGLYFDKNTYPALPGTLQPELSMSTNLGPTPVFLTWDDADTVDESLAQNPVRRQLLESLGGTVVTSVVSGTTTGNPPQFATHSWAVLDVVQLCDFFEPLSVQRRPATVQALLDQSGVVSNATLTQRTTGAFSSFHIRADGGLSVHDVVNAQDVQLDARAYPDLPVQLTAASNDADGFRLEVSGFAQRPAYMLDAVSGRLVNDVHSDPVDDGLLVDVAPSALLRANVHSSPGWTADLITSPNPVKVGQLATIQAAVGQQPTGAWLLIAALDRLNPLPGGLLLTASLDATSLLLPLPVDPLGIVELDFAVPSDPALIGEHLHLQLIAHDAQWAPVAVSNMWMAYFY